MARPRDCRPIRRREGSIASTSARRTIAGEPHRNKKANGRVLFGRTYDEMPEVCAVPVPPLAHRRTLAAELAPEANEEREEPLVVKLTAPASDELRTALTVVA